MVTRVFYLIFASTLAFEAHAQNLHWQRVSSGTTQNLYSAHAASPNGYYAAGQSGIVLSLENQGQFSQKAITTATLYSLSFKSPNLGWAAGAGLAGGGLATLMKTSDGGKTWQAQTHGSVQALRSAFFVDSNTGYVSGNEGTLLKTMNSGSTWTSQQSHSTQQLRTVFFSTPEEGYVAGTSGALLKTMDGGSNWTSLSSGTTLHLNSMYFINSDTGYVVGDSGLILKTQDGGDNWSKQESATKKNLHSIGYQHMTQIAGGFEIMVAVGDSGTVLVRGIGNRGEVWSPSYYGPSVTSHLRSVHFPVNGYGQGLIVGDNGVMLAHYLESGVLTRPTRTPIASPVEIRVNLLGQAQRKRLNPLGKLNANPFAKKEPF
jgi:photosystem II stability/assembly factor-like uncharacterized protein